jgi:hypothetical protein
MRRTLTLIAAAAAGLSAAQAAPLNPAEAPDPSVSPEDGFRQVPLKVAPRIWLLHQREPFQVSPIGNVSVIEQADGLVLVDSGASRGSGERGPSPLDPALVTRWAQELAPSRSGSAPESSSSAADRRR